MAATTKWLSGICGLSGEGPGEKAAGLRPSRLEGLNKERKTRILIGPQLHAAVERRVVARLLLRCAQSPPQQPAATTTTTTTHPAHYSWN